jgi:hypothetical protein
MLRKAFVLFFVFHFFLFKPMLINLLYSDMGLSTPFVYFPSPN